MKKIFQLCFSLGFFAFGFSQELKPIAQKVRNSHVANKTFVKYDLFTVNNSVQKQNLYKAAAEDVTVMKLNKSEIQKITSEKPAAMEMSFPFEGKNITVELVKNEIFADGFSVKTDKGTAAYTPGVYYHGIVKGDNKSVVAFSFFENDVMGVASQLNIGNIVLGKAENSEDYVSYNDMKMTESNPFRCGVEELPENDNHSLSFDPEMLKKNTKTTNCVRVYYEVAYNLYTRNSSNVTTTTNWVTAMFNNVKTLYDNDNISIAMSDILVWTSADPYPTPDGNNHVTILNLFKTTRPTFNGDVGQLFKYPDVTSVAWRDTLCTTSNYSFCGMKTSYSNIPAYSWNIMVMAHEMGHNLGSPHTHGCYWNGDNTAIDGCAPTYSSSLAEGSCPTGPLPVGTGGTIMSYCHLLGTIGTNMANGFGEQPAALMRNRVDTSACLSGDCTSACQTSVTNLAASNITENSATITITDNTSSSWVYRVLKTEDGTVVDSGTQTAKVFTLNGLAPGTYYKVQISNSCTGSTAYERQVIIYTDADWCSGVDFMDTGGDFSNYEDGETLIKTFYPKNATDKLKLTFSQFDLSPGDFMNIYNGPSIASPRFSNGIQLTGNDNVPGPFESTHATGAITVRFISNSSGNEAGWKAKFDCLTLATKESDLKGSVNISPNPTKGSFTITSKDKIVSYDIYDASGKMTKKSAKLNSNSEKVDISASPAGTYIINVTTDKETVTRKVTKY